MVQAAIPQPDEEEVVPDDNCYYHIDKDIFGDDEPVRFMMWQRLCWEGSCSLCKTRSGPRPVLHEGWPKSPNWRSMHAAIKQCAVQDSYILANMSVTEVAFRILLRIHPEPMQLSKLMETIDEAWKAVMAHKSVNVFSLQEMLDSQHEYPIKRCEPPPKAE